MSKSCDTKTNIKSKQPVSQDLKRTVSQINDSSEDESDGEEVVNRFANDGNFLKLFQQMQQQQKQQSVSVGTVKPELAVNVESKSTNNGTNDIATDSSKTEAKRKPKVLKVGVIKKQRPAEEPGEGSSEKGTAWDQYLSEVRTYRERLCGDDDSEKNRPLVK